jgi:hypothetical protein
MPASFNGYRMGRIISLHQVDGSAYLFCESPLLLVYRSRLTHDGMIACSSHYRLLRDLHRPHFIPSYCQGPFH